MKMRYMRDTAQVSSPVSMEGSNSSASDDSELDSPASFSAFGATGRTRRVSNRPKKRNRKRLHFDVEDLQQYYHLPLKTAAEELGICEAALKRICRRNQIQKWPYRQLASVMRRIEDLKNGKYDYSDDEEGRDKVAEKVEGKDAVFRFPHEVSKRQTPPPPQIGPHGRVITNVETKIRYLEDEKKRIILNAHLETLNNKQWPKQEQKLPAQSTLKKKSGTTTQQVQENKQQQHAATRLPSLAFCQERSKKERMRTLAEDWGSTATQFDHRQESMSSLPSTGFRRPPLLATPQRDGLLEFLADVCSSTLSPYETPKQRKILPCLRRSDHRSFTTKPPIIGSSPYKLQVKNADAKSSLLLLSLRK